MVYMFRFGIIISISQKQSELEVNKMKNKINKIISSLLVIGTVLMIYTIFDFGMLPVKYFAGIVFVILSFVFLMIMWIMKSNKNGKNFIGLLLAIALILGTTQVSRLTSTIGKITGADTEVHVVNVIVMKDSSVDKMKDLKDSTFGANYIADTENIKRTLDKINEKEDYTPETEKFTSYENMINALYDGSIEAIILSDSHTAFIEEIKENFEDETKIVESYMFADKVVKKNQNVDVTKDTFSIFVSGIDTYGKINSVSRSDVNMIVTVNPVTKQILLTSIPRDYYVKLHSFGVKDKLTHAGIYGVNESVHTLEDLLTESLPEESSEKIEIDYYLRVNFTSVINIVDALGGVQVNSNYAFKSGAGPSFTQGMNTVNGTEALAFVRERYNLPNGDFDRIVNQQALITGIINKMISPAIITNYGSFLNSIGEGMEFSMNDSDLNKLIRQQLDTMSSWDIINIQLKGTGASSTTTYSMPGWNLYVSEPDYASVTRAAQLIQLMERGEVISAE